MINPGDFTFMTLNPSNQRTIFSLLIAPFAQVTFGIYVIGISLIFIGIAGFILVQSFLDQYEHVMEIFKIVDPEGQWALVTNEIFYKNLQHLSVALIGYMILMFYVVFKLTHRYYGPIVALTRILQELKSGNYKARVHLRQKDEFQNLATELNLLAEHLDSKYPSE
jgi:hypothetical protein